MGGGVEFVAVGEGVVGGAPPGELWVRSLVGNWLGWTRRECEGR